MSKAPKLSNKHVAVVMHNKARRCLAFSLEMRLATYLAALHEMAVIGDRSKQIAPVRRGG